MDEKILNTIIEHRNLFVPSLFTSKQVDILHKYTHKEILNNTEKAYLYSAIKKKIDALNTLKEEFYVSGEEMIPERVEQAKQILKEINKPKAFISGSFLNKKVYRDIDIYIIAKGRKSYHQKKKHFIFITQKMLRDPLFLSSLKYSVANFSPPKVKPLIKRPLFEHLNLTYQMTINEILNKEEERTLREIVFMYYVHLKRLILNSYSLYYKTEEIIKKDQTEKINEINQMVKALILKLYSKKYMYQYLTKFVKGLKADFFKEQYHNFPIFIDLFTEVKNECRAA